ncbi:MAG TPA: DUF92 domain-containing protein [Thermoanaerobaculia bacterium]|nr:DUF92 domain-containing protein [Thermoanaerobaculia bacterium]
MGLLAFALRWLDWKTAAAVALGALLFNLFVMPRIGRGIYRDPEKARDTGIVAYAGMVLVLILLFRDRYLPMAAAVWAMMAFGDPAAAILGRRIGGPALPWNPEKTWSGTLGNWAVGSLASSLVVSFVTDRPLLPGAAAILVTGSAVYAFLESVRSGVDDNLVAAIPTALAVFQLSTFAGSGPPSWLATLTFGWAALAAAVNGLVAFATWRLGVVTRSGAVAGAIAGFLVLGAGEWGAYAVLWAFFLAGTLATKLGYRRKARRSVAQAEGGRRGAAHVAANVAVPAALLLLGVRPIAYVAALAAALADTLGTEIGALLGRRPFSLLRLSRRAVGEPGAVSVPGIAGGAVGAALIGAAGLAAGLIGPEGVAIVAAAGLAGSLAESLAFDFGKGSGARLDHDFANAFNTLVGALVALEISLSLEAQRLFLPVAGQ